MKGFQGDSHQRLGGADFVHITGKAACNHNQKTGACRLFSGKFAQGVKNVEEEKAAGFDAFGGDIVNTGQKCEQNQKHTGHEKHHGGLVTLENEPAGQNNDRNRYPWK